MAKQETRLENALAQFRDAAEQIKCHNHRWSFLEGLESFAWSFACHRLESIFRRQHLEEDLRDSWLFLGPKAPPRWYNLYNFPPLERPTADWRQKVNELIKIMHTLSCEECDYIYWRLLPMLYPFDTSHLLYGDILLSEYHGSLTLDE